MFLKTNSKNYRLVTTHFDSLHATGVPIYNLGPRKMEPQLLAPVHVLENSVFPQALYHLLRMHTKSFGKRTRVVQEAAIHRLRMPLFIFNCCFLPDISKSAYGFGLS